MAEWLFTKVGPLVLKSVPQGAATEAFVATRPSLAAVTGEYFADCNVGKPCRDANGAELTKKLWEASERIAAEVGGA